MVQIEPTLYGLKVTFTGDLDGSSLKNWLRQSKLILAGLRPGFRVLLDLRGAGGISKDALLFWEVRVGLYERRGMRASMALLPDGRAVPMAQVVNRKAS